MTNLAKNMHFSFNEACVTFRNKHNIQQLSKKCGVRRLAHKLNDNSDGYMTVTDLIKVTESSKDPMLIDAVLLDLGMRAIPLPTCDDNKKSSVNTGCVFTETAINMSITSNEVLAESKKMQRGERYSRSEYDSLKEKLIDVSRNALFFMSEMESRFSAGSFACVAGDMISSGAGAALGV